jgi:pyruvate dehydrogenase E2 component (dihydrolipoamide acetyltransferase)
MIKEIKIPEIGENVTSGQVVGILVSEGEQVEVEQPIIEFETDKAVVEIPSPAAGKITEVLVKEGDSIDIDAVIAKLDTEGVGKEKTAKAREESEKNEEEEAEGKPEQAEEEQESATKADAGSEPEEKEKPEKEQVSEAEKETTSGKDAEKEPSERDTVAELSLERRAPSTAEEIEAAEAEPLEVAAPASPSVRRLARELGADINRIKGSGPQSRITIEDVKAYVREVVSGEKPEIREEGEEPAKARPSRQPLPDFSKWGDIEREPMSQVRTITARSMAAAWTTVAHVTQFDKADITAVEKFRQEYSRKVDKAGGKLTITAILLKVLAAALKQFPRFNASLDIEKSELIYKKYCHIGMAVDTSRGLLVPVIRDVDKKSLLELAVEVSELAERARNKKVLPEDFEGGTFTISNQGGIGGTDFTPIVYWPQAAILGISRGSVQPVYVNGNFQPRTILPLSLSYDHRINDGADAARFLKWVVDALEQPMLMYLDK